MPAQLDVLTVGYATDRVAGTVVAVRDGDFLGLSPALIVPGHGTPFAPAANTPI